MRKKNVKKAAHALFLAQGDDKNAILATRIHDREVRGIVKDQGRALVLLEKLILPQGKLAFTEEEMEQLLLKKLKKKGHRIQDDDEEDTPEYAEEKRAMREAKLAMVPSVLGISLDEHEAKKQQEEEVPEEPWNEAYNISALPLAEDEEIEDRSNPAAFMIVLGAILAIVITLFVFFRRTT